MPAIARSFESSEAPLHPVEASDGDGTTARVTLTPAPPSARGSLSAYIDASIEARLQELGGCPRSENIGLDPERILEDQLYRARLLGYRHMSVTLGSLRALTEDGVLTPSDSQTLAWWRDASRRQRELRFALSADDREVLGYALPARLDSLWGELFETSQPAPEAQPAVASRPTAVSLVEPSVPRAPVNLRTAMRALLSEASEDHAAPALEQAPATTSPSARVRAAGPSPKVATTAQSPVQAAEPSSELKVAEDVLGSAAQSLDADAPATTGEIASEPGSQPANAQSTDVTAQLAASHAREQAAVHPGPATPIGVEAPAASLEAPLETHASDDEPAPASATEGLAVTDRVAHWLEQLQAAEGGQSYADLEQLFSQSYLPLRQAVLDGHGSPACARQLAQFSSNFAGSYARAFEALRSRGKRPSMVLDAPQLAFRLARQHAAPKHHLLLVDAMRFDIGARVEERLQLQLLGFASCVARGTLWAALPADTATQLELLARGADGLRHLSGGISESQLLASGLDMRKPRPMRVGPHHLYKLDAVQYQVTHVDGPFTSTRLMQCSADAAVSIGRFIRAQAPGTLVFVFGDHGFNADGSSEPSPEQVLVGYQAWLVRDGKRDAADATPNSRTETHS